MAIFDRAFEVVSRAMADAARQAGGDNPRERMRAGTRAFLAAVAEHPDFARTLLVEIIAAGPVPAARRDQVFQGFADILDRDNAIAAERGLSPRFASPLDAFAVVGAITELVSRQVRLGEPPDALDLAPVIDRLIDGMLLAAR